MGLPYFINKAFFFINIWEGDYGGSENAYRCLSYNVSIGKGRGGEL